MDNCDIQDWGQEKVCTECGIRWDLNDKDVPLCYNRMLTRTEIRENLLKLRDKM